MVEEGSKVDPFAPILEHTMDELNELDNVVGAVNEETSDHAVLSSVETFFSVDFQKVTRNHGEVGVVGHFRSVNVRKSDRSGLVLVGQVVCILVNPRVDGATIFLLALVQDIVGGYEHVQAELISLTLIAFGRDFVGKPGKTSTGDQDFRIASLSSVQVAI